MRFKQSLERIASDLPSMVVTSFLMLAILYLSWKVVDWELVKPKDVAAPEKWEFVKPTGSMMPCYSQKDKYVFDYNYSSIQVGDVVQYEQGISQKEYLIMHRVIYIVNKSNLPEGEVFYITKGDANPYPDPWLVSSQQVVAKLEKVEYG